MASSKNVKYSPCSNESSSSSSSGDEMEDAANGHDEYDSTYDSSFSSPIRLSSSENSSVNSPTTPTRESNIHKHDHRKDNFINDISEIEIRGHEEGNSNYNSSYSSPVRLSSSEISVNSPTDVVKEDEEKGIFGNETNTKIRSKDDDNSAYNSSYSSPVRSADAENSINAFVDETDIVKGQEKGISVNYTTVNSNESEMTINAPKLINVVSDEENVQKEDDENGKYVNDETCSLSKNEMELRGPKDGLSNSPNSINAVFGKPDVQNKDNENGKFENNATLGSTTNDTEIKGPIEGIYTDVSSASSSVGLSNASNSINVVSDEQNVQKEDDENGKYVNDETLSSSINETEFRGTKDGNSIAFNSSSSPVGLSNSPNSINVVFGERDVQNKDNENGKFVNDVTLSSTSNDTEIIGPKEGIYNLNSINAISAKPDIQKKENENGNFLNDATLSSNVTDMEIIQPKDGNFTDITSSLSPVDLSNSLNSFSAISGELNFQNEVDKNRNSVNDATLNSTKNDIEIRGNSSSSSPLLVSTSENLINSPEKGKIVNYTVEKGKIEDIEQSTENVEMKSKDIDFNDQKDIIENSSYEETETETETWNIETDSKEIASNKEGRLIVYRSRDPNPGWPGKATVLSKFLKFKNLYTVSNIFRRISKKANLQNDSNENSNVNDESSSLIRVSDENSQEDKNELKEVALDSPELKAITGRIILYTKLWCKDCKAARAFLRNKKLRYSEINIDVYPSRKMELEEITGSVLVPKVFFNHVLIGGLNELKGMDESGELEEKIEFVTREEASPKAPQPPFSGEDDVSSRGVIDELAIIVRKMKESVVVKDRFYKFRRVTNCFRGSEAVDFLSEDQFLERAEAIEFGRKLAKELFFRHALEENIFEDGNHPYLFLDHDPVIGQCQNIPRGLIQMKRQPLAALSYRLKFLLYAILDAYTSDDGRHIAYRTIHGSEEFARYLRIAEELQRLDLNRTSKEERLAFFINLYNMMAIHAILVWGHPDGAMDRRKLLNDFKYVIGGCAYSLSDIYNGILRSNQRPPYTLTKPFGITDKRFKVSLPYPEPLIHFALVFGNRSAPPLRCYCPGNIDRELMDAARDFLQSGAFVLDIDSMTISVTKILKWYSVDFGRTEVEVLKHAANYLDFEKTHTLLELLNNTQLKVVYQPYDWRLNS